MLPKNERELIKKIGRYKYNKLKELNLPLTYQGYIAYENEKKKQQKLKKKIGYRQYNEMERLGLNYEEYKQFKKEEKLKKYERKREKDKTRFRTIRFIERYCNLEMKCQICGEKAQIHHPNYNDYLKINLLCKKHHIALHNFELVLPPIIDLEKIRIKNSPAEEKKKYIEKQMQNMKIDIQKNEFSCRELAKKYEIAESTIRFYLLQQEDYQELKKKLKSNAKKKQIMRRDIHKGNPLLPYKDKYNLTSKEIAQVTNIPLPTIRAIEIGKTNINNITPKTRQKLSILMNEEIMKKKGRDSNASKETK